MSKILFIHAGGAKTGSSALQNYLETNAEALASRGFFYGNTLNIKSAYEITSGNGLSLIEAIISESSSDNDIDQILLSFLNESHFAICSSEIFAQLKSQHWQKLDKSSVRVHVKLKIIYYVRNPVQYFISGYDQLIKAHGVYNQLSEIIKSFEWDHNRTLRALSDGLAMQDIMVIHYDSVRDRLIQSFLDAIGVPAGYSDHPADYGPKVNRSLTNEERKILCMLNARCGDAYSSHLSQHFIYTNPELQGDPPPLDQESFNYLSDRYSDDVGWINRIFFNGSQVVQLVVPSLALATVSPTVQNEEAPTSTEIFEDALCWAFDALNESRLTSASSMINQIIQIAQEYGAPENKNIPHDFDLVHYLILNPDVLIAKIDPYKHYEDYGRAESRRYRIPSKAKSKPNYLKYLVGQIYKLHLPPKPKDLYQ